MPSPPPYKRKVLEYCKSDTEKIRTCLSNIDWDEKFNNLHVDEMVKVFTSAFIEIVTCYIPHKIIKIDDRDPPWITCGIKTAVKCKHGF